MSVRIESLAVPCQSSGASIASLTHASDQPSRPPNARIVGQTRSEWLPERPAGMMGSRNLDGKGRAPSCELQNEFCRGSCQSSPADGTASASIRNVARNRPGDLDDGDATVNDRLPSADGDSLSLAAQARQQGG